MRIISVDGGTTNTRLVLINDGKVLYSRRLSLGLRDQLDGNGSKYSSILSSGIRELLTENNLEEKDIDCVTVSGMICSEHGLYEVPHIPSPVSVRLLSLSMKEKDFLEIAAIPFYLVPGVKTFKTAADLCDMDIMRGEETELCGIMEKMNLPCSVTLVLPGSHCKIIPVDGEGMIKTFVTTVSGELIRAAAEHTILRDGIRDAYPSKLEDTKLLEGFDYAREHGLTEAMFKVRILQKFRGYTPDELFAVLCGIILSEDIRVIEKCASGEILVGGSDPFRSAIRLLLKERTALTAEIIPDDIARYAVAYGAERLIRERKSQAMN